MQKEISRARVLFGAILCQICAGMLYSSSLYVKPLTEAFNWERSSVTLTFSIATFLIPIIMIFAARLLPKIGPAKTVFTGAVFLAAGLAISSFAQSLPLLYLGYGVLGGTGVGFIYGVSIATCVKWFPDRKGLISGLTVAGFGLGSILFSPVCTNLIQAIGPSRTFLVQASITLVGALIGAPLLNTAPDGFRPNGWTPPEGASPASGQDHTTSQMLRTRQYWFLLIMYLFANMAGLFVIGHASPISQEIAGLTAIEAGLIVSVLSIFNTAGRFLGGAASDKFGAAKVVAVIYALDVVLFLFLRFMSSFALIAVGIGGLAVCFGAMMGAYPSLVIDYFGAKNSGSNYAFVFLAYGIGGLLANFVSSASIGMGSYTLAFIIIGASCVVGCTMSIFSRKPVPVEAGGIKR